MRNIDRIHTLEKDLTDMRRKYTETSRRLEQASKDAARWRAQAENQHRQLVDAHREIDTKKDQLVSMEMLTSTLLIEAAIIAGEPEGGAYVLRLPRPDTKTLLDLWKICTVPTADEYIMRVMPRKEAGEDAAADDSTGVPADDDTGAVTAEVPERQD